MTMELRHLRAVLAIAEEGNVTRAATRLHLGHPALSRTLRQLEDHLGARLVDRSTRHLELTAEGHVFRDKALAALAAVETALDPRGLRSWPLRLGHTWAALGDHTIPLLRRWDQTRPGFRWNCSASTPARRASRRARSMRPCCAARSPRAGLRREPLLSEERVVVMPADSPLAALPRITLTDLAARPIALNTVSGTTTTDLWPPTARPVATIEVTNTDEWFIAIAAGRGPRAAP
ncbi:LysR family transcriptional regulator [Streptomyces phaeochromogenes]